jgi:tellurite resistance protein TerC
MIDAGALEWACFLVPLIGLLAADRLTARAGTAPSLRRAALTSGAWIALSLAFAAWLARRSGADTGLTFLTAYLLEKSLSVDNLFIFGLIFSQTGIPPDLQRRALFWGVAGAFAMRALMIAAGVYLLARFHWVIYPFAALLAYSAVRMLRDRESERMGETACRLCTSWVARIFPITPHLQGTRFTVNEAGRRLATPLLVAVVALESTDLLFAVDSIPAVLSVTRDPFLVYTSNIYALMGLRSLYFLLSGALHGLRFLRPGLAVMLLFTAAKMLASDAVDVPPLVSLAVIVLIFGVAIGASRLFPGRARTGESSGF